MPRRLDTCPACRAFIEPGAPVCPYCMQTIRVRRRGVWGVVVKAFEQGPARLTLLVSILVMFGVEIWMSQRVGGGSAISISPLATARLGSNWHPLNIGEEEWWRFFTALFLHGGIIHLLFNAWVMVDLTRLCEQVYGTARIVVIYLASGLSGNLVSLLWHGEGFHNVGASGALCGLIGLMAVYGIGRRGDTGAASVRQAMIRWLIYIAVLGFLIRGIDNAAHLGGAAGGAALGLLMAGRSPRGRRGGSALAWRAAAAALVAATLLAFGAMIASQSRWAEAERLTDALVEADRFQERFRALAPAADEPDRRDELKTALLDLMDEPAPDPGVGAAREAVARAARAWIAREGPLDAVAKALTDYEETLMTRADRNRSRVQILLAFRNLDS